MEERRREEPFPLSCRRDEFGHFSSAGSTTTETMALRIARQLRPVLARTAPRAPRSAARAPRRFGGGGGGHDEAHLFGIVSLNLPAYRMSLCLRSALLVVSQCAELRVKLDRVSGVLWYARESVEGGVTAQRITAEW